MQAAMSSCVDLEKSDPAYKVPFDKVIKLCSKANILLADGSRATRWMYDHPFKGKADYAFHLLWTTMWYPKIWFSQLQCYQTLGMQDLKGPYL